MKVVAKAMSGPAYIVVEDEYEHTWKEDLNAVGRLLDLELGKLSKPHHPAFFIKTPYWEDASVPDEQLAEWLSQVVDMSAS